MRPIVTTATLAFAAALLFGVTASCRSGKAKDEVRVLVAPKPTAKPFIFEEKSERYAPKVGIAAATTPETEQAAGETAGEELPPTDAPARFLAPEQIDRQLQVAFGYRHGWAEENGTFHSALLEGYRVALGGMDFDSAKKRDANPKVSTLLVIRNIAYEVAWGIVNKASDGDKSVFSLVDFQNDRPLDDYDEQLGEDTRAEVFTGEARWTAQLEDIYWRAYGRPPARAEVEAIRETFARVGRWPPEGWALTLYAIMSTAEFWNL